MGGLTSDKLVFQRISAHETSSFLQMRVECLKYIMCNSVINRWIMSAVTCVICSFISFSLPFLSLFFFKDNSNLCIIYKNCTLCSGMKPVRRTGGLDINHHTFLMSELNEREQSASRCSCFADSGPWALVNLAKMNISTTSLRIEPAYPDGGDLTDICHDSELFVKVNLSLWLKHYSTKGGGGVEIKHDAFLTSSLDEDELSASRFGCFTPGTIG